MAAREASRRGEAHDDVGAQHESSAPQAGRRRGHIGRILAGVLAINLVLCVILLSQYSHVHALQPRASATEVTAALAVDPPGGGIARTVATIASPLSPSARDVNGTTTGIVARGQSARGSESTIAAPSPVAAAAAASGGTFERSPEIPKWQRGEAKLSTIDAFIGSAKRTATGSGLEDSGKRVPQPPMLHMPRASPADVPVAPEQLRPGETMPCIVTAISEEYVDGHEVFVRSLLRTNPWLPAKRWPLVVLDQGISQASLKRVRGLYERTLIRPGRQPLPAGIRTQRGPKWKANLQKLFAIFHLPECAPIVKIDTGDMMSMGDVSELLAIATNGTEGVLAVRALFNTELFNGGLLVLQRDVLTQDAANELAEIAVKYKQWREQELLRRWMGCALAHAPALDRARAHAPAPLPLGARARGASSGPARWRVRLLPKVYNMEWKVWAEKYGTYDALPRFDESVLFHFVGPKPWTAKLKHPDKYDYLWWRELGKGRLVVIGAERMRSAGKSTAGVVGWIVDEFEHVVQLAPRSEREPRFRGKRLASTCATNVNRSWPAHTAAAQIMESCAQGDKLIGVFTLAADDALHGAVAAAWRRHLSGRRPSAKGVPPDENVRALTAFYKDRERD